LWGEIRRWHTSHVVLISVHVADGVVGMNGWCGTSQGSTLGISRGLMVRSAVSDEVSHSATVETWSFGGSLGFIGYSG
jgi:hypothetical protein